MMQASTSSSTVNSTNIHTSLSATSISSYNSTFNPNSINTNVTLDNVQNLYVDIQAQFELAVELRRFMNIDLFQRGYYQVRLTLKCPNKQIPTKILVQLENNANNNNLSGKLFIFQVLNSKFTNFDLF
jgi:hypothetical protein